MIKKSAFFCLLLCFSLKFSVFGYRLTEHPRIFIDKAGLPSLAERAVGPLAAEYSAVKALADRALAESVKKPPSRFRPPYDMVCAALCYLVERQLGHDADPYAETVKRYWGDGSVLGLEGDGFFGFHGMAYDWIYDALTPGERISYGGHLGTWLRYYTDRAEITLKWGGWLYNQTWGPAHLNTPNTRDGITPKLFVALALHGAGTTHEEDAGRFLDSWAHRVPAECIPAFDEMGGVWSESMGHGSYGPVVVIPWAFEAWRTATGENYFDVCAPASYLRGMTRWAVHLTVPFAGHTAWIDDNRAGKPSAYARVAPILGARYRDPVANWISDRGFRESWSRVRIPLERLLSYDPTVGSDSPGGQGYPLAHLFSGAGHVYMRDAWDDPDATWAFFGTGPKFAGHSRDDEGSFLIAKKGWLVLRAGGQGHNDTDYYAGGSLAFNIVTIYDPEEKFRRTAPGQRQGSESGVKNENDGGLIRYVYSGHNRDDRGRITAYQHDDHLTYAAADLSQGYSPKKVSEVTRQFLYLRGPREFFIIFDRIQATSEKFPKTWFLHMPGEPKVIGEETVVTPGHVFSYTGNTATWASDPAGEEDVLSTGRSRAFLKTLLPRSAKTTKRGGDGHHLWGHPHNPDAQYNHVGRGSLRPPIVPWRLEVEAPFGKKREYFLHVLEIGDEGEEVMSEATLLEGREDRLVGVRLDAAGTSVEVLFAATGPMSATVKQGDSEKRVLGSMR